MLSIEESAQMEWLMASMKKLLEKNGIAEDNAKLLEAKEEQRKIDEQKALIEQVIDAQQLVADKYNPILEQLRAEEVVDDEKVKEIIETMTAEAKQVEDDIISSLQ